MADHRLKQTASQTVGPYFAYGLTPGQYGYALPELANGRIAGEEEEGEHIRLLGQVFDGEGQPVPDAMIEVWQADAKGRFPHPADPAGANTAFRGFGRFGSGTEPEGRFVFRTVKPGATADGQAPHLNLILFMRGLLSHIYTRVYFADETTANASDPVLALVPAERRNTLLARREETAEGPLYRFDIHMQGEAETVFFEV